MTQVELARQNLAQAEAWPARNERDRRAKALVLMQIRQWLVWHDPDVAS